MAFNFFHPPEDALPPEETRFLEARIEPWPDGKRIRIHVAITPFQKKPDLVAQIFDSTGRLVTRADILETMDNRLVFTMHLRGDDILPPFRLEIGMGYQDIGQVDLRIVDFNVNETQE